MNDSRQVPKHPKKLSLRQALSTILLSICLISGSCFLMLICWKYLLQKQRLDHSYEIVAVVQTSQQSEGLKTSYLTELLELSIDYPRNLYTFNTQEAVQKLLRLSVIKEAKVTKILPGTIHVDYELRKPIAYVGDYTNTAIDEEGIIFPFKPFYTPKNLPEIYFGETEENLLPLWKKRLTGKRKELAFTLLHLAPQYCDESSSLRSIDVSQAFALSDGQRQVVIKLEDRFLRLVKGQAILYVYPRILRLSEDNYKQQLGNYLILRSYLREKDLVSLASPKGAVEEAKAVIIDLRLSELAFFAVEP